MTTEAATTGSDAGEVPDPRFATLADRPGTVFVVGASRHGPTSPDHSTRPVSSIAAGDGVVECPRGAAHLDCDPRIAVVIGSRAHRVSVQAAWDHVAWVSAAGDFGMPVLSSEPAIPDVMTHGGAGSTPIGPGLIDAREVDPAQLGLRSWRNGVCVHGPQPVPPVIPLAQAVAELSSYLILDPGDVILVGTAAGAMTATPDDVVEVEVTAGAPAASASSGRLLTTVVAGADRAPRAASSARAGLDPELRRLLLQAPVAAISAQLRKQGIDNATIEGIRPLRSGVKMVGTARTLRFVPNREDLFRSHGGGYNAQKRAFDAVESGEVIVIEARGETGSATLGDILAIRAHSRGASGIVTDGGVRDAAAVSEVGIPVYAAGPHPAVLGRRHVPWEAGVTVACGGTTVQPGDVIVGDDDGVIVISPELAAEVAGAALAQEHEDAWIADQVASGHPVAGLFPMNAEWRARYEEWRRAR